MTSREELIAQFRYHRGEVDRLQKEIAELDHRQHMDAIKGHPELEAVDEDSLYFGYWECKESPTGHCIYDVAEDPWKDECLICGDPSERK
jgi:hypothetical protein